MKRFTSRRFLYVALPVLLLFAVAVYSVTKAAHTYATNSDALVYNYLLDGAHRNQIVLPGQHTNILKLPFFWVASLFPYTYKWFMVETIGLVLVSLAAWTWLLVRIFGRRYAPLIMVSLAALLFTSTHFDINIAEMTIRNIEFPLALWFVLIINDMLRGKPFKGWDRRLAIAGCLLYALLLSGDNYFFYAVSAPILVLIGWYWAQSRKFTEPMVKAAAVVIGAAVLSLLIKAFLNGTGLVVINQHIIFPLTMVDAGNLGPSLVTAGSQLLHLQGAYVFGASLSPHNLASFINLGVLVLGLIGLGFVLVRESLRYRAGKDLTGENGFIYGVLSLSFIFSFFVYVCSGQVIHRLNGMVLTLGNERYLAFAPLLLLAGFLWLIITYYGEHKPLIIAITAVLLIGMVSAYPATRDTFAADINASQPAKAQIDEQIQYLDGQGVHQVLAGYWYGSPLRFVSGGDIRFATIVNCDHPFDFNVRKDWYTPSRKPIDTALIVDRTGPDASFWNGCDDSTLHSIYGQPSATRTIGNTEVWVYHYDTRERLKPFALSYY